MRSAVLKKALLAAVFAGWAVPACFAEMDSGVNDSVKSNRVPANVSVSDQVRGTDAVPSGSASEVPIETIKFTGKVDDIHSVSGGNDMSGPVPQMTVEDDKGQVKLFAVAGDAVILDREANTTTLDWIKKDDRVTVEYTTAQDGTKIARSIKVSPDY